MITTAITAGLTALLSSMGLDPGLYVVPMWVAVKVLVVTPLVGGGLWFMRKREAAQKGPPSTQP